MLFRISSISSSLLASYAGEIWMSLSCSTIRALRTLMLTGAIGYRRRRAKLIC